MSRYVEDLMESDGGRLVRFFGRIASAQMECPACGTVMRFGGRGRQARYWNKMTNRVKCPSCSRTYQLGLLAWPVRRKRGSYTVPHDQLPNDRQRGEIRAQMGSVWMTAPRTHWSENTNLTCTCQPGGSDNWVPPHPHCPLHGDEGLSAVVPDPPALA